MNKLLSASQVAQKLGVSVSWVRDHASRKRPRLPVVRLGVEGGRGLLKFREEDVEKFILDNLDAQAG